MTLAQKIEATERRAQRLFNDSANGTRALRLANEAIERCMFARHFNTRGKTAPAKTELAEAERALRDATA